MPKKELLFDNVHYMRAWRETIEGAVFTFVETGPAMLILPVRRNANRIIELLLIEEYREEVDKYVLKGLGGYLRGLEARVAAPEILLRETGLRCEEFKLFIAEMNGFTTVRLPICTYLALGWNEKELPIHCISTNLVQATEMVLENRIGDQATSDAILRMYALEQMGYFHII